MAASHEMEDPRARVPQQPGEAFVAADASLASSRISILRRLVRARPAASKIVFGIVLLAGLLLRLLALRTGLARQNSDTSIVYLMARHVEHGDLRVFYWGQVYGGTLFQLTAGALFWLVGASIAALQVVEIAYWLAACLLLRSIVAQGGGRLAGDIAASVFWLASPYVVSISFSDPGFYGDGLAVGLAAIRAALGDDSRLRLRAVVVGLCFGLGLWLTPLTLAFTLPAAVTLFVQIRCRQYLFLGFVGGLVGAAPWIWFNVHTNFASLHREHGDKVGAASLAHRYIHVYTQLVPAIAGYAPSTTIARIIATVFPLVLVLGLVVVVLRRANMTVGLLCISGLLVPAVVAASGVPVVPAAGRYATLMVPSALAVLAMLASALSRRRLALLLALGCLVPIWTTVTLWNETNGLRPIAEPAVGAPIAELGEYLEQSHRSAVWADYWVSYLLSAATQERVIAAALAPAAFRREPSYERAAMRSRQTTVVLFAGGANDRILRHEQALPSHRRVLVGPFAVWFFNRRLEASQFLTAIS